MKRGIAGLRLPGLGMVRFQLDAQKTFPRVQLSITGTGGLESSEHRSLRRGEMNGGPMYKGLSRRGARWSLEMS